MAIKDWSTTAADNNSTPPNGWPEGMLPSQVNNSARQMMADVRAWYEEPSWIDYGYTVAYASDTSFTVTGADATAQFAAGRRVKLVGSTTVYGVVASSSFSTNTTVNVTLDSGTVPADLSAAYYAIAEPLSIAVAWSNITGVPASASYDGTDAVKLTGNQTVAGQKTLSSGLFLSNSHSFVPLNTSFVDFNSGDASIAALRIKTSQGTVRGSVYATTDSIGFLNASSAWSWRVSNAGELLTGTVPAANLSGTVATARLGSGTASSSTYLRGDQTWASLPEGTAPAWGEITGTLSNQTDLNSALSGKQATITGGATSITSSNLTASRALVSDGSGKVGVSAVTATELGYLDNVTSNVQTQLNAKEATLNAAQKRYIYVQSTQPTANAVGDLWVW